MSCSVLKLIDMRRKYSVQFSAYSLVTVKLDR